VLDWHDGHDWWFDSTQTVRGAHLFGRLYRIVTKIIQAGYCWHLETEWGPGDAWPMKPKKILTVKLEHFEEPAVRRFNPESPDRDYSPEIVKRELRRIVRGRPTSMSPWRLATHALDYLAEAFPSTPRPASRRRKPRYQREQGLLVMGMRKRRARRVKTRNACRVLAFQIRPESL
jgi:hypothetical protein